MVRAMPIYPNPIINSLLPFPFFRQFSIIWDFSLHRALILYFYSLVRGLTRTVITPYVGSGGDDFCGHPFTRRKRSEIHAEKSRECDWH